VRRERATLMAYHLPLSLVDNTGERMATPKERHDARDLARESGILARGERADAAGELSRSSAAPVGAEEQADGQPENERELHDHSAGGGGSANRASGGGNAEPEEGAP
jgi:hypothetical protein